MRNFVKGIKIAPDLVYLTYSIPMPSDGTMIESESVLGIVQSSPPPLCNHALVAGEAEGFEVELPASFGCRALTEPAVADPDLEVQMDVVLVGVDLALSGFSREPDDLALLHPDADGDSLGDWRRDGRSE